MVNGSWLKGAQLVPQGSRGGTRGRGLGGGGGGGGQLPGKSYYALPLNMPTPTPA